MKIKTRLTLGQPKEIQSMKRYIAWGFLFYVIALIVLSIGVHFIFPNADRHSLVMAITMMSIVIATAFSCEMFDRRHKRPMFYQEYCSFLWGFIWTTVLFQVVLAGLGLMNLNIDFSDPKLIAAIFGGLIVGITLYVLAAWLILRFTVINYWKRHQKLSKKAG